MSNNRPIGTVKQPRDTQAAPHLRHLLDCLERALKNYESRNFRPSRGTVLVRQADPEEITEGGVIIPEVSQAGKTVGVVVAAHPNDEQYEVGDVVVYRGGSEVAYFRDGDYVILQHQQDIGDEILGKIVVDSDEAPE